MVGAQLGEVLHQLAVLRLAGPLGGVQVGGVVALQLAHLPPKAVDVVDEPGFGQQPVLLGGGGGGGRCGRSC